MGYCGPCLADKTGSMNRLPFMLCLLPVLVQAQTITLGILGSTNYNITDCTKTVQGTWHWTPSGITACSSLVVWATSGDCSDKKGAGDVQLDEASIGELGMATTGTFDVKIADLPAFAKAGQDGGVACGAPQLIQTHKICASVRMPQIVTDTTCLLLPENAGYIKATTPVTITYDSVPPAVPTIDEVTALDGALGVAFTVSDDTSKVIVQLKADGATDFSNAATVAKSDNPVRVRGLTNGTNYTIRLIAVDAVGNQSPPSAEVTGAPIQSDGFWVIYKRQGGDEQGGCHAAPASLSLMAGASILLLSLSRRRKRAR